MKDTMISIGELRSLIKETLEEDSESAPMAPQKVVPPAPMKPGQKPASAEVVQKFKSSINMMADAGARAKAAAEKHDMKETERWLAKSLDFGKAAQDVLSKGRMK